MSVCYRIDCPAVHRDRLLGELDSSACLGVQEEDAEMVVYFSEPVDSAWISQLEQTIPEATMSGPDAVLDQDWSRSWRVGLEPRRIGAVWVRPSWTSSQGQPEIVIDPGQAFGTGEHATTQLCLELLQEELIPGDRVLDVGSGSGILALGALRAGARWTCGFDLDPVASPEALRNARVNRLAAAFFTGPLDALAPAAAFDVVTINMISSRLLPLIEPCASRSQRGLVVSGYLEPESERIQRSVAATGFALTEECFREHSGDSWGASLWQCARG